jgi:hypothetical protein
MKKIIFINIALILAGFLSVKAQNKATVPEQFNRLNTGFEKNKINNSPKN